MNKKKHWETVYNTKTPQEVSWTQKYPKTSIEFIKSLKIDSSKPIIDVGGGDSHLVDVLIKEGFTDITVLDISEKALLRAQERLGENSKIVSWIVCDILDFKPTKNYSIWHDRAAFHFLTEASQIKNYTEKVNRYVSQGLVIGTFSENGPQKCSGIKVSPNTISINLKLISKRTLIQLKVKKKYIVLRLILSKNLRLCALKKNLTNYFKLFNFTSNNLTPNFISFFI